MKKIQVSLDIWCKPPNKKRDPLIRRKGNLKETHKQRTKGKKINTFRKRGIVSTKQECGSMKRNVQ